MINSGCYQRHWGFFFVFFSNYESLLLSFRITLYDVVMLPNWPQLCQFYFSTCAHCLLCRDSGTLLRRPHVVSFCRTVTSNVLWRECFQAPCSSQSFPADPPHRMHKRQPTEASNPPGVWAPWPAASPVSRTCKSVTRTFVTHAVTSDMVFMFPNIAKYTRGVIHEEYKRGQNCWYPYIKERKNTMVTEITWNWQK